MSPNQQRLFAIEAPIDMDESIRERLKGRHRILFFDFLPQSIAREKVETSNTSSTLVRNN
jgi:hypothetical protein